MFNAALANWLPRNRSNRWANSPPVENPWPTTAGASQSRRTASAPAAHSAPVDGALPGLASPQPTAPPPCIATITVSSFSRGPSGVCSGWRSGKPTWNSSMESIFIVESGERRVHSGWRAAHSPLLTFHYPLSIVSVQWPGASGRRVLS